VSSDRAPLRRKNVADENVRDEVERATPDDDDIAADLPSNPGTEGGGDLNAAGSEPAGRGE